MSRPYVKKTKTFMIGDVDQDPSALKTVLWELETDIKIDKVRFGADTDAAAQDTNYNEYKVTDGTNTIASLTNGDAAGGDDFSAGAFTDFDPAAAYAEQDAGAVLLLEYAKEGSGRAISGLTVQIDYYEYGE